MPDGGLRLIEERLSEHDKAPSLSDLAELCGLSVRQLTRGFRVSRGCSIGDYLEQRRIESAKRMLMRGEAVKGVAFALGFASPSSFTFAFRRAVGSSPTRFRQKQARGNRCDRKTARPEHYVLICMCLPIAKPPAGAVSLAKRWRAQRREES